MTDRQPTNVNFDLLDPEIKAEKIMERISVADPYSGILVFKTHKGIRSAFAKTMLNVWALERDYEEIGVFDRTFNPTTIRRIIREAAGLGKEYA